MGLPAMEEYPNREVGKFRSKVATIVTQRYAGTHSEEIYTYS